LHQSRTSRRGTLHSLVIYLAFFLPVAANHPILIRIDLVSDVVTISFLFWIVWRT